MLNNLDFTKILFLDIECVSTTSHLAEMPDRLQTLWQKKAMGLGLISKEETDPEALQEAAAQSFRDRAAIYAEYGKVICISVGVFDREGQLRLKSFADDNERTVLEQFSALLNKSFNDPTRHFLSGHNIKEFDIPYLCRRMAVHQLPLPNLLDIGGKKPWETNYMLDTLHLWRFGDYKAYTSLNLLTALFGIPSPKDDIDGSQVGKTYWDENDLPRIAVYCQKDVLAVAQVLLYLLQKPILTDAQVLSV
jgi:3'-5' exonuclease